MPTKPAIREPEKATRMKNEKSGDSAAGGGLVFGRGVQKDDFTRAGASGARHSVSGLRGAEAAARATKGRNMYFRARSLRTERNAQVAGLRGAEAAARLPEGRKKNVLLNDREESIVSALLEPPSRSPALRRLARQQVGFSIIGRRALIRFSLLRPRAFTPPLATTRFRFFASFRMTTWATALVIDF